MGDQGPDRVWPIAAASVLDARTFSATGELSVPMGLLGGTKTAGADRLERWLADGYAASYRTAYLILHNHQDAEEALQDAFLRAWRFRDSIPDGEGVQPWMYRVVVNACLSKLRADRHSRRFTGPLDAHPALAATGADPGEQAAVGDTQRAVVDALATLPEHLRVVVVLRFYAGLSEREIAGVIRRRPGTVKSRVHEAKLLLGRNRQLAACLDGAEQRADRSAR